jgi:hypothetical protein
MTFDTIHNIMLSHAGNNERRERGGGKHEVIMKKVVTFFRDNISNAGDDNDLVRVITTAPGRNRSAHTDNDDINGVPKL